MPRAPEWNDDFADIVRALIRAEAEFLIVGAHALALHGIPRATGDLDILVRPTPENANKVWAALVDFGVPVQAHGVTAADFEVAGNVYQLGLPPRRIDLLTSITGVGFDEAWEGRETATMHGLDVAFLGREGLLRNKRATARPKDLADAEVLERHSKPWS